MSRKSPGSRHLPSESRQDDGVLTTYYILHTTYYQYLPSERRQDDEVPTTHYILHTTDYILLTTSTCQVRDGKTTKYQHADQPPHKWARTWMRVVLGIVKGGWGVGGSGMRVVLGNRLRSGRGPVEKEVEGCVLSGRGRLFCLRTREVRDT